MQQLYAHQCCCVCCNSVAAAVHSLAHHSRLYAVCSDSGAVYTATKLRVCLSTGKKLIKCCFLRGFAVRALCQQVILNGDAEARYAGNLNLSFAYVEVSATLGLPLFLQYSSMHLYVHWQAHLCQTSVCLTEYIHVHSCNTQEVQFVRCTLLSSLMLLLQLLC
jgi:hypothetical protein